MVGHRPMAIMQSIAGGAPRLTGRGNECEVFDRLLAAVRAGESRALVVRGEPGVGKTTLLQFVAEDASDLKVARAVGVEAEMELPFAGLHQLLAGMLDRVERLPVGQREALRTAFGLSRGSPPDRFLVGLATLSLLSEVAEERPLVCLIDDEQWLDRASAQVLSFVARRLEAESVGMVFAARTQSDDLTGVPELVVEGLTEADAGELLDSALSVPIDAVVRNRVIRETRGNPLALLELARGLTPAELAGGFGLPMMTSVSNSIEESFRRQLDALPADTQRLLRLAAADPVGDPVLLWRAAEQLAIPGEAAIPAIEAGLIEIGAQVRFRHPFVRSAAYRSMSGEERRNVHSALAWATSPELDPDRRSWHRAHAAARADEGVAGELERSATRAEARGGIAAAAAFLERASELTVDPARRAERALAAAQAKLNAGAPGGAAELLDAAEAGPLGELGRARADLLRAQLTFAVNRGGEAPHLLLNAAKRLEPLDPTLARDTYLEAVSAGQFAGRLASKDDVLAVARSALSAPPAKNARASDVLLDGLAMLIAEGYESGAPIVKRALVEFRREDLPAEEAIRWLWLACRTAVDLWDFEGWKLLSERMVARARESGALGALALGLTLRIGAHLHAGELSAVTTLQEEVEAINEVTGSHLAPYGPLLHLASQGGEQEATALMGSTLKEVSSRGEGQGVTLVHYSRALLFNGLGRYDDALSAARLATSYPGDLGFRNFSLAELVEAATRTGDFAAAAEALEQLTKATAPSATDWALGVQALCGALLSDGNTAEELYCEAIAKLERSGVRLALGRAHLLYGEWLRRERRRMDARKRLRTAHEMFSSMGVNGFATRARRELLATGETVRRHAPEMRDELTAQELHIARLARDGLSNPEIATRLFISPRTVQYHLRKVFIKLGIRSRMELDWVLPSDRGAAGPS
jgi:DNA-binding CsgD family transcriptional regulator